jgi:hypothetical protein
MCIRSNAFETVPQTCIATENEPEALLSVLQQEIKTPQRAPGV